MPKMDIAFTREGRFDVLIPMLSPDEEARMAILDVHLNKVRKVAHNITPEELRTVAMSTPGWKGNMLEELIKRATRIAFVAGKDKVSIEDLKAAKDDYKVNTKALEETEKEYVKLAEEICNSRRFLTSIDVVETGGGRKEAIKSAKAALAGMPTR
jgi:ATP-dependent 26S proteasome regulatory subunit